MASQSGAKSPASGSRGEVDALQSKAKSPASGSGAKSPASKTESQPSPESAAPSSASQSPSPGQEKQTHKVVKLPEPTYKKILAALGSIKWPNQMREVVDGNGYTLGVTNTRNGPRINSMSKEQIELTKLINSAIADYVGNDAPIWGSIQVNHNTISKPHIDFYNKGDSMIMLLGDFNGGSFQMEDQSLTIDSSMVGQIHRFNGNHRHLSLPFSGTRFSIIAFYHVETHRLSQYDWQYLRDLGFQLHYQCDYPDSFLVELSKNNNIPQPISTKSKSYNRRLIELFCGPNSVLGRFTEDSCGCDVFRVTERMDMFQSVTHDVVVEAACADNVCLWISAPCKGGSRWNQYNWCVRPELRPHISRLVLEFITFLTHVIKIIRRIRDRGFDPSICLELPESCAYWYMILMQQFLDEFDLRTVVFHGCAYGLKAQHPPNVGKPIMKPWKVATSHPVILMGLERRCKCTVPHAACAGKETSGTENYTFEFAGHFHKLLDYIVANNIWNHKHRALSSSLLSTGVASPACCALPPTLGVMAEPPAKGAKAVSFAEPVAESVAQSLASQGSTAQSSASQASGQPSDVSVAQSLASQGSGAQSSASPAPKAKAASTPLPQTVDAQSCGCSRVFFSVSFSFGRSDIKLLFFTPSSQFSETTSH